MPKYKTLTSILSKKFSDVVIEYFTNELVNLNQKENTIFLDKKVITDALKMASDCSYTVFTSIDGSNNEIPYSGLLREKEVIDATHLIFIIEQNGKFTSEDITKIIEEIKNSIADYTNFDNTKVIYGDYITEEMSEDFKITALILK
ncbi:hypothetical protein IJG72_06835 [bacterium]|nr:hypothetical protein [bacterium]